MKINFEVKGFFYKSQGYKLRKYLDIKRKDSNKKQPELMVVMMNPGSSFPMDGIDNNSIPSTAEPDTTQKQIIKVMNATSIDYTRIINLSDLRTPDSNELYRFLKSKKSNAIAHSIFSPDRKKELDKLFTMGVPVIYAWGVNTALIPLAKLAIKTLDIRDPIGLLKPNTDYSYYHPLPRIYAKQIEWLEHITNQLNSKQGQTLPNTQQV